MDVEIFEPPSFSRTGIIKDRKDAWKNGDWIGSFNLWIVQADPTPAIVYQQRSSKIDWAPNKLDVSVAGHYENLETIEDCLRETREELNKEYKLPQLTPIGRRLNVGLGTDGTKRNTVSDLFVVIDNSSLSSYRLDEEEVFALCLCPIEELLKVHTIKDYQYIARGLRFDNQELNINVTKEIFPYNWDNYHYKMAKLLDRFIKGERDLIY